jgi:hypothetical protein
MYTLTRYIRLVGTLNVINQSFWFHQLYDPGEDLSLSMEQTRRKRLMKLLRLELNDMAYYGVSSPESV